VTFGTKTVTSSGEIDGFLVVNDSGGTVVHLATFGETLVTTAESLALTADGSVYVAGTFRGTVTFAGTTFVATGNGEKNDAFIAKWRPSARPAFQTLSDK
jgi:hypothetical protein